VTSDHPDIIHVGFTGTRHGMTRPQCAAVLDAFSDAAPSGRVVVHVGMCVGADAQAARMARASHAGVVGHPPLDDTWRAWFRVDELRPAQPYLQRNLDIISECTLLIAAPRLMTEERRSGTWHAIRHAAGRGLSVRLAWPDGTLNWHQQVR
jgi:hypothetical protein